MGDFDPHLIPTPYAYSKRQSTASVKGTGAQVTFFLSPGRSFGSDSAGRCGECIPKWS